MLKITIESDDGERAEPTIVGAAEGEGVAPPAELAERAEALGATSAGPAPSEVGVEGPVTFVEEPGVPETAIEGGPPGGGAMSAGGAPEFAAGALDLATIGEIDSGDLVEGPADDSEAETDRNEASD